MDGGVGQLKGVGDWIASAQRLDDLARGKHDDDVTANVTNAQALMTNTVIARTKNVRRVSAVLTTDNILAELAARKVKRARIAEALGLPAPRITELYKGERRLYHDEAVRLVEAFNLEQPIDPLPAPVARLLVLHTMNQLGHELDPDSDAVQELALDFQAFAGFAASQAVSRNMLALEAFLRGRQSVHPPSSQVA